MSSNHITPHAAQQVIAEARRGPQTEDLINDRHLPHIHSANAVTEIMKLSGQTEFDRNFDFKIDETLAADEAVTQHTNKWHNQLWGYIKQPEEFDPVYEAKRAWQRHGDFLAESRRNEAILDYEKRYLGQLLTRASRHHGFPLSPEQIHGRLRAVQVGYTHELNRFESSGFYYAVYNHAFVDLNSTDHSKERLTEYHELFHAISAQRYVNQPYTFSDTFDPIDVSKVGLSFETKNGEVRRWMNEAMTEIMAEIFTDVRISWVQFDHPEATMEQIGNGVIPEILGLRDDITEDEDPNSYTDMKVAFLNAFADIPFKLLVDAYFIQDKDDPVRNEYLGAAAEKELWRELKRRGGKERIKQLRDIDDAFESGKPEEAREIALGMKKANLSWRVPLKRGVYSRQVSRNTQQVQKRIRAAKSALADQKTA